MTTLPLTGFRIVDLTMVWAGPYCTQILGDLGADVIKVESVRRFDPIRGSKNPPEGTRGYPDDEAGIDPWNRTARFNERNRNKLGLTLDLTSSTGILLLKQLVAVSDVVIENFSAFVMDKFGLSYSALREIKPDIVMLSMPGFGKSGPEKGSVAYGITMEAMAGLGSLTGYGDGWPIKGGVNTGDPIAALHAAGAVLAALHYRTETGIGQNIDLSQQESAICVIGEVLMDYAMNARIPKAMGNRDPGRAPQGCYPCRGEDEWIALSVSTEQEWHALCDVMGASGLVDDSRFKTKEARLIHHNQLDDLIASWTRQQDRYQALHQLQRVGVASGVALNNRDLFADPHVLARQSLTMIDHPSVGLRTYPAPAIQLSATPATVRRPAPRLGEHNQLILGELLNLSEEEIARLEQQEIIGNVPLVER